MKAQRFCLFVLALNLALMSGASGALAQGAQPGGTGNPAVAQQQAQIVELVGQIGGTTAAIAVQGSYACISVGSRLVILDVSDPTKLTVIGRTDP